MEARYDICKDSDEGNDADNATDTYLHNGLDMQSPDQTNC